jgi:hypothetical protein
MRPPRFRLRALMIAVAVTGLALGGERMRRRRAECLRRAESCAGHERLLLGMAAWCEEIAAKNEGRIRRSSEDAGDLPLFWRHISPSRMSAPGADRLESDRRAFWEDHCHDFVDSTFAPEWAVASDSADRSRRLAARYAAERLRYERAARYPWLPVEPDPPEPE